MSPELAKRALGRLSQRTVGVASSSLLLGLGALVATPLVALAVPDFFPPAGYFTSAESTGSNPGTDVLNLEFVGPDHNTPVKIALDFFTASDSGNGAVHGWKPTTLEHDLWAQINSPGVWEMDQLKIATGGDDVTVVTCGTPGCRNHARLWPGGTSDESGGTTILTVSTEHYHLAVNTLLQHVVDSYNDGRDQAAQLLDQSLNVPEFIMGSVAVYPSGCVYQPDGTCAPYDGNMTLMCTSTCELVDDESDGSVAPVLVTKQALGPFSPGG